MKIEKNKMVSVTYELREGDKNGNVVEVADKENPLAFPFGLNLLLPSFEAALLGKETGDVFEVGMSATDGYGEINDFMIVDIPKDVFMVDGELDTNMIAVGNRLPMMSDDGNVMNGLVTTIKDAVVVMDFNHPLAGKALYFTGEVIDVRDSTDEELKECCGPEGCGGCGDDCEHSH